MKKKESNCHSRNVKSVPVPKGAQNQDELADDRRSQYNLKDINAGPWPSRLGVSQMGL
jgi:hypothetical protein